MNVDRVTVYVFEYVVRSTKDWCATVEAPFDNPSSPRYGEMCVFADWVNQSVDDCPFPRWTVYTYDGEELGLAGTPEEAARIVHEYVVWERAMSGVCWTGAET